MARTDRITTMSANGPPPQAAAVLYPGKVMHHRLKPFGHRFAYTVFSLLVDIDRLDEVGRVSWLLSVNRGNLASFWERDHVERDGETLRAYADRLLAGAGLPKPAARILLLAYPRILGYAFNPISVYFAYDEDDMLIALDLRGAQHLWRAAHLCGAGRRRRSERSRHPPDANENLPRLALHRHGHALQFPYTAARQDGPAAHP